MGLDMCLYKENYIWNSEWRADKNQIVTVTKGDAPDPSIQSSRVRYVIEEVAYWRKANQIHNWFVQNCGGGVDECQRISVSIGQLKDLLEVIDTVLTASKTTDGQVWNGVHSGPDTNWQMIDDFIPRQVIVDTEVAEKLLPSASGFFFGGTNYDEFYLRDLVETKEMISKLLAEDGIDLAELYYQASW